MHLSFLRVSLLSLVLAGAPGCSDPTSPRAEIAARFDGLAAKLTLEDQPRKDALRIAAHTLRRGAPINTINLSVGSVIRTFNAVAIQAGLDTDPPMLSTTIIAWRGSNAEELLHLQMYGSELQFADTSGDFPPYIGNATYDAFYFIKGTEELWYRRSGEGHLDILSEGATCQPLKSNHTCKAIQVGVDFAVKTRLAVDDESITERIVTAPRTALKAIRYLRKCEPPGDFSSSCFVSLISEGTDGGQ